MQWATEPQAPWLESIFDPLPDGLGLGCPAVMVHGNHEGFAHLERLVPRRRPAGPVDMGDLPAVDSRGYVRLLPSGWRTTVAGGRIVGGIGGIERGQRRARYHPMAYIDDAAVEALCDAGEMDVLITHQGPTEVQGAQGSETLQVLLDAGVAKLWFHGHSTPNRAVTAAGRDGACTVVPLGDTAFAGRGRQAGEPGLDGWSYVTVDEERLTVVKETPPFWRDYRRSKWYPQADGQLICPDLYSFAAGGGGSP